MMNKGYLIIFSSILFISVCWLFYILTPSSNKFKIVRGGKEVGYANIIVGYEFMSYGDLVWNDKCIYIPIWCDVEYKIDDMDRGHKGKITHSLMRGLKFILWDFSYDIEVSERYVDVQCEQGKWSIGFGDDTRVDYELRPID